jgi:hypothetical protein
MSKTSLFVLGLALLFAGCVAEVRPPSVRVKSPYPAIDYDGPSQGGKFCPPGQAKKGRC